jgi:hypothetical protein
LVRDDQRRDGGEPVHRLALALERLPDGDVHVMWLGSCRVVVFRAAAAR